MVGSQDGRARVVGVDVGTKRVGIAVSDPLRLFAKADGTYPPDDALGRLQEIDGEHGIEMIVVGWPLTEDGEEGEATEMVDAFVGRMNEKLDAVDIIRRDERFTSEMAKDLLREAGVSQPGRFDKGRVDAAAAAVILQDFLDLHDD